MNTPDRGGAWRLPALIIGAGALLALLALLLALRSKDLLKDVVRQGSARHAQTVAGQIHSYLLEAEAQALAGSRPAVIATVWVLVEGGVVGTSPAERGPPPAPWLEAVARHVGPERLPLSLEGAAATWLPRQEGGGVLVLWDLGMLARELEPVVTAVEGDDRYGVALQYDDSTPLPFEPRVALPVEPPLAAWRVAVGIEDPEAVRDALRLQTGLLVALATWLLIVLVGGMLVLMQRQRQAAGRQARREQFLARAYHELQTPLALLRAAAESVERGALERPQDLQRALGIVKREEARLTATIRRLLRVLRLQGGIELELVPAADEVRDAAEEQRASLDGQQLKLELEVGEGLGALRAPRDLLGDVTRELLANACKHAREGRAVRVALTREGARARLVVSDDGPGFGSAVDSGRSGLGLTLVEEALLAWGGRLERGASPQGGAQITVELPCQS